MAECQCERCKGKPAVQLMADCGGDALVLCRECWDKWFNNELMFEFNNVNEKYIKVENPPAKYKESGNIYVGKNVTKK